LSVLSEILYKRTPIQVKKNWHIPF